MIRAQMPKPTADLLPEKPAARLRIYGWTSNEVAERWRDCIKVGQTTQANVNDRIKQSQGQARVNYTLEWRIGLSESASPRIQ